MARRAQPKRSSPSPRRAGWVVLMLLTLVVASSAAIAQSWTNLRAIGYGYEISKARRQRGKLLEAHRRLRIEVALLKSPRRIAELAGAAGLRPPEPDQLRRLRLPRQKPSIRGSEPSDPQRAISHNRHRSEALGRE